MATTADAPVLAYVVNPDGTGGIMDTDFAGIQQLVEGYVEVIVGSLGGETVIACVNEDGLMAGKPVNNPAQSFRRCTARTSLWALSCSSVTTGTSSRTSRKQQSKRSQQFWKERTNDSREHGR